MKRQLFTLVALMGAIGSAYAEGDIYKCVNANGTVEFKNTGPVKDCKKLDIEGISVIPAPAMAASKSRP